MHARFAVPLGLLAVGAALIADAVLRGGASVALVVVVPVIYGASTEFFVGVLLLFFGFVTLPFLFGASPVGTEVEPASAAHATAPPTEVGGLMLIGPVPIFFGGWKGASRRTRVALAVLGGAVLVALIVVFVLLR
jgi:uncharacterized membrane protein